MCLSSLSWLSFTTRACSRSGWKASGSSYLYISFILSKALNGLISPVSFLQAWSPSLMILRWLNDYAAEPCLPPRILLFVPILGISSSELSSPGRSIRSQPIWKDSSLTFPECSVVFFLRTPLYRLLILDGILTNCPIAESLSSSLSTGTALGLGPCAVWCLRFYICNLVCFDSLFSRERSLPICDKSES